MRNYPRSDHHAKPKHTEPERTSHRSEAKKPEAYPVNDDYRNLLLQAPAMIAILRGRIGTIELYNDKFKTLWGNREVTGASMRAALPELEGQSFFEQIEDVFDSGIAIQRDEYPAIIITGGMPKQYYFNFVYAPLRNKDSTMYGVMIHGIDVTEQVEARMRAESSEQRLRIAQMAGNIGTFEWIVKENRVVGSAGLAALHGLEPNDFEASLDYWLSLMNQEDRETILGNIEQTMESNKAVESEYRIVLPDGTERWLAGKAEVFLDEYNEVERLVGVSIDITARKQLEQQKDDFIGIASHELKTPVTSIRALNQLLQTTGATMTVPKRNDLLQKMDRQISKLSSLITNLLDVTKIQSGRMAMRPESFNVDDLIYEIVEELQQTTTHKIGLRTSCKQNIYADRERTAQVIVNLITNAIKYSPGTERIEIRTRCRNNIATITVTDFGIGMSKEQTKRIFDRFYRGHSDRSNRYPGLGLGLYISTEIVRLQNGTLSVISSPGKGSEFTLTLPLAEHPDLPYLPTA